MTDAQVSRALLVAFLAGCLAGIMFCLGTLLMIGWS